jgi:hypothetical protein
MVSRNVDGVTVICRLAVATWAEASVIWAEKLNVPVAAGEPDRRPSEERVNPPGRGRR